MSLTRQHFVAVADALYRSRPTDGHEVEYRARLDQWYADRSALEYAMRRFNHNFDRSRFEWWTEHGESEATTNRRAVERTRDERAAARLAAQQPAT